MKQKLEEKTMDFVKKSYKNIPMYAKKWKIDENAGIEEYPLIEKNYVIDEEAGAISPEAVVMYYRNELLKCRTSGSTGKYMEIYWKEADYIKSMLPLWKMRCNYYGIRPEDRMCFFFTIGSLGEEEMQVGVERNAKGYSKSNLSLEKLKDIYEDMLEYSPKWLLLQPSTAVLLCKCIKKYDLPRMDSVKYIELSGEILTTEVRNMIYEAFGCSVANQYGANEFNSIAYECPCGNMHILTSNVYVETVCKDKNKSEGLLYITTKTNTAMPLIRYGIGDIGSIDTATVCKCGNRRPILNLTSGTANDSIITKSGEERTSYVLVRAIDRVNYIFEGVIKQFQIVQESVTEFQINLVIDDDEFYDTIGLENLFISSIADDEVKECDFKFNYFDVMFPDVNVVDGVETVGKFAYFKRRF